MNRTINIAAMIYALSILLSRVVGLAREFVIGRVLGDSPEADVYWVAFILPDFLNYLLAGGALSLVLIPLLQAAQQEAGSQAYWRCFWRISTPISLLIISMTALLWVVTPQLVNLIAPGFDLIQNDLLIRLTRIILPAQIFHVCGGLISSTLQAQDRHLAPALAPLLYTGTIIVCGLSLGPSIGAEGFAWGVLLGSFLGPFLCPLFASRSLGLRLSPRWEINHREVKVYLWRALPVMLGFSIVVLDDMLVKRGATELGGGVTSQLHYARSLMKVPMGVFGLAMGMATFPSISRLIAQNKSSEALDLLRSACEVLLVLVGLSQTALMVGGSLAARLIWGGGRLSPEGVEGIGVYCAVLSLGLWAWSMQGLVARGFYAKGQTWAPTLIGSVVALSLYPIYQWSAHTGVETMKSLILSLSTHPPFDDLKLLAERPGLCLAITSSLAISLYVTALWVALSKSFKVPAVPSLTRLLILLFKIEAAALLASTITEMLFSIEHGEGIFAILLSLGLRSLLACSLFLSSCLLFKVEGTKVLKDRIFARFQAKKES